ncbi:MAG TPA: class I SAM-dependent methyltransferase [Nocardioides sp.]|nr:class I SAM-dependent methyltransferase [Nocardioides sp.]
MSAAIGDAYDRSADAWRSGPAGLYAVLAGALLDRAPIDVAGGSVLDAGAGSGVAGDAARARGAVRVVGVDLAPAMLSGTRGGVAADLVSLPFRDRTFDLAVAAFSIGHVTDPASALTELRRVAPALLVSAFAAAWTHPAKDVVERVLVEHGYRPPAWYRGFKDGTERQVGDPDRLVALATGAGYRDVEVARRDVATGLSAPADLVAWRLGMAHHAPFVAGLAPGERVEVATEAEALLAGAPEVVVPMLVLTGT